MFFILLLPFCLVAWFLGVFHANGKTPAKFGFLVLLILPVPLELQGLVIFITAFFIFGFLYTQEGSFSALYLRLRAVLGENTPARIREQGEKRRTKPFKYKQKRQKSPFRSNKEPQPEPNQENPDFGRGRFADDHREEVRKKREEEIKQEREGI